MPPSDESQVPEPPRPAVAEYFAPEDFLFFTNPVLEWNKVAIDAALVDSQLPLALIVNNVQIRGRDQDGPTRVSRAMAIVHLAIYRAVAAFGGGGRRPADGLVPLLEGGFEAEKRSLVVAAAARRALVALFPQQRDRLAETFSHYVRTFRRTAGGTDPIPLFAFGEMVARGVLAQRADDGSDLTRAYKYLEPRPIPPGVWRPDPIDPAQQPLTPRWGFVRPFALAPSDVEAFVARDAPRIPPPPGFLGIPEEECDTPGYDLANQTYQDAVEEVRAVGRARTDDRSRAGTLNAIFWSYDSGLGTNIRLYNQNVRAIAYQEASVNGVLSDLDYALLFLLVNVAMADATIATWRVKYFYRLWRPVHAIRLGPDPAWEPLGKRLPYATVEHCSPPFPAYTSGHSGIGAAAFVTAKAFFESHTGGARPRRDFYLTSDEVPGYWQYFADYEAAIQANGYSRIQLGVHFPFDNVSGNSLGRQVAELLVGVTDGATRPPAEAEEGPATANEYCEPDTEESDVAIEPLEERAGDANAGRSQLS